jgi:hypothetical protein
MTGIAGFILGALFIASFAVTASKAYATVPPRKLQLFSAAFGCLAAAMLLWALTVIVNTPQGIRVLMLASDCLLLLGTGCMVQLLVNRSEVWFTTCLGLIGSLLVGLRAFVYPTTAFVQGGLLYFNLSKSVQAVIIGALLLLWIPAVIVVASYTAKDKSLPSIQNILTASFLALVVVTALFLSAHRSAAVIGFFAIIAALFLAMTVANVTIMRLHKTFGVKHAARSAAR